MDDLLYQCRNKHRVIAFSYFLTLFFLLIVQYGNPILLIVLFPFVWTFTLALLCIYVGPEVMNFIRILVHKHKGMEINNSTKVKMLSTMVSSRESIFVGNVIPFLLQCLLFIILFSNHFSIFVCSIGGMVTYLFYVYLRNISIVYLKNVIEINDK